MSAIRSARQGLGRSGRTALLALTALACSGSQVAGPGPTASRQGASAASSAAHACPRAMALDERAIGEEIGCLLQRYVQLDTTNPPGNERIGARFLQGVLAREGIVAEVIESAPGRANLIARLPGRRSGQALMWVHHMDVVAAAVDEWSVPPLSGLLREGFVWGRGSLDNKGAGVAQLVALLLYRRLGIAPPRELVLLAVADEESGGAHGARWLVERHPELFDGVAFALNEGGGILELEEGRVIYAVELAQKAPLWLRVTAHGRSGHGGAPEPGSAAAVLVRALSRLERHEFALEVLPEVQAMFRARAEVMPEPQRSLFRDLEGSLRDPAFRESFLENPRDAALVRTTAAITMLAASPKENVVSERASAVLDVRVLPGRDPEAVQREIEGLLAAPALEVEPILSWRAHASSRDTPLFAAIERLAAVRHPGAPVTANVIGGFTDCNAFRAHGLTCYGFLPLQLDPAEFGRIHGKDERASVSALARAVLALHELVEQLGAP